jgi:hypothetical protein
MKVVEIRNVEDCFDGSSIKELRLSDNISKPQIYALAKEGDIQYFAHFSKPFYKIRVSGLYDAKGIEGNDTMRVHLKSPDAFSIASFEKLLTSIE